MDEIALVGPAMIPELFEQDGTPLTVQQFLDQAKRWCGMPSSKAPPIGLGEQLDVVQKMAVAVRGVLAEDQHIGGLCVSLGKSVFDYGDRGGRPSLMMGRLAYSAAFTEIGELIVFVQKDFSEKDLRLHLGVSVDVQDDGIPHQGFHPCCVRAFAMVTSGNCDICHQFLAIEQTPDSHNMRMAATARLYPVRLVMGHVPNEMIDPMRRMLHAIRMAATAHCNPT